MKKICFFLFAVFSLAAVSCQPEKMEEPSEDPVKFKDVTIEVGQDDASGSDTKSQIANFDAEKLQKAAMFAFFTSDGKIVTRNGQPVVKTVTFPLDADSYNFSWSLPLDVPLEIYTIANYGDLDLSSFLSDPSLTKAKLDALTFTCSDSADLISLSRSGYGLPMSGITGKTLTESDFRLQLKTRRLFARYDFYIDASPFTDAGYTLKSVYISSAQCNTQVPYFSEGFRQTDASKLNVVDFGTASDIAELNYSSKDHPVTLYFLENNQGSKTGCNNWYEVAHSGLSGLELCSYIDLGINTVDPDGNQANFFYWIYLGDDCKTNFDVRRNERRTIKMTVRTPDDVPPTHGLSIINAESTLSAVQPAKCRLYFETSLSQSDLSVSCSSNQLTASVASYGANKTKHTAYPYAGYVDVSVIAGHNSSEAVDESLVTVGKSVSGSWVASDERPVSFGAYVPSVTYGLSVEAVSGISAKVGSNISLKAYYDKFEDGETVERTDVTSSATWTCSSSSVSFPSPGTVRSSNTGRYTICATYEGCSDTIDITFAENEYIRISDYRREWEWDEYGPGTAKSVVVQTNIPRNDLSVSYDDSLVECILSDSRDSNGGYTLSMWWKSENENARRSVDVFVSGAGRRDYASMIQNKKPTVTVTGTEYQDVNVTITASPTDIPASGGTSTLTATASYRERVKYSDGSYGSWQSKSGTPTISGGESWATLSGNTVTAAVNTGDARSATYYADFSIGGQSATQKSVTITQAANTAEGTEYQDVNVTITASPTNIPAAGGNSTLTATATWKERVKYSNGTYSSWQTMSGTPTISGGATGFSRNGYTVTVAINSGNARSATYTASLELGGQSYSDSVTISQVENTTEGYEYQDVNVTITASPTSIPAAGGTSTLTATVTWKERVKYSNGTYGVWETKSDTPPISGGVSWATLSGNTVTVSANPGGERSVTYTAWRFVDNIRYSDSVTITQAGTTAESTEYKDINVSITASPTSIPAAGGTSTLTATATWKERVKYSNGTYSEWETKSDTPIISGGASWATRSGNTVTVSANSSVNARSVTYYADFSIGGKSATQKSVTITQKGIEHIEIIIDISADTANKQLVLTAFQALPCNIEITVRLDSVGSTSYWWMESGTTRNNFSFPSEWGGVCKGVQDAYVSKVNGTPGNRYETGSKLYTFTIVGDAFSGEEDPDQM